MDYIRHTRAIDKFYKNLDLITEKLKGGKKTVIFGTNKISGMMAYYLEKNGIAITAFIDNDKARHGEKVFGIPVFSPEGLLGEYDSEYRILIVSGHQESMVAQLENMGYSLQEQICIVMDLNREMEDFGYIDRSGMRELSSKEIREGQLRALRHLKEVCEKNNLKYYLCGGTLLGAVRHKGYIPWDDDIDVFLELEDLKKLNEIMKADKEFSLISFVDKDNDYFDEISLFVDNSAIMDNNHFPIQMTTGITIDIFYLSGIPDGEAELREYALRAKELEQIKWNKFYSNEECKKAVGDVIDFLSQYKFGDTKRVGSVLSPHFLREVFEYESFQKTKQLLFEGELYAVPGDYHTYLKQIYGDDYMIPPPENNRVAHHSFKAYKK
ncbi:MAG: hypothetical protein HDT39_08900 [Lachnospiraceae bacterium]|nr:hypothetical protein [Lachnospiraceae bacterium]